MIAKWVWEITVRLAIAVVLILIASVAALAERRVALVFGADRYDTIRPLANAVNDARAVEEALTALGFEVYSEANRDLRRMRRALEDFAEDAAGADVAFVYFAGHGVEIAGDNRLLPTDVDASSLETLKANSLPLEELRRTAGKVADIALIVLDACRNDPFAAISDPNGRGAKALRLPASVKPGLGRLGRAENTLFAFSAAPGETAADGEGENSPFTAALAKYLGTDGLEIRSVLTLVQQEVYDKSRGAQLPYVESGLPQLFFASETTEELPERERLLLAMADISPQMREDVERIASDAGMPLAPLYGALIGGDISGLNREQRTEKLREAAASFTKVRDELRTLRSGDERVTALRREAEEQLALGAFDGARAKLSEAANIDATSRETLKTNLIERTLSEAATHYLNGGAAAAELKYQLAIADYKKAAALYEEVGAEDLPPNEHFQHTLVLSSLGEVHKITGDAISSLIWYEALLAKAIELADSDPHEVAWQQNLAASYYRLGDIQISLGNLDAALSAIDKGLRTAKRLADSEPANQLRQESLASLYILLGDVQVLQGNRTAAYISFNESLAIRKRLVAEQPEIAELRLNMLPVLQRIGNTQLAQGRLADALESYTGILSISNEHPEFEAVNPNLQRDRSVIYGNISDVYFRFGKLAAALEFSKLSLDIARKLAETDPANTGLQNDLAVTLIKTGEIQIDQGILGEAETSYGEALAILQRLGEKDPGDTNTLRYLSMGYESLGFIQLRKNNLTQAREHYDRSLEAIERLSAKDPTNGFWQRDLWKIHVRIGELELIRGKSKAPLEAFELSRGIMEKLTSSDPSNAGWQHDFSISLIKVGDVRMLLSEFEEALVAYRKSLEIRKQLAVSDSSNAIWEADLSTAYDKIGDAALRRGDRATALAAYLDSLEIREQLAGSAPDNANWQRNLATSYHNLAEAGDDPRGNYQKSLDIVLEMQRHGILVASDGYLPGLLRQKLHGAITLESAE